MKILQKFRKDKATNTRRLTTFFAQRMPLIRTGNDGTNGELLILRLWMPIVLLVSCLSPAFAQTQVPGTSLRLVPPSPTAASLGRYGDVPVSYYTGAANLSIPLHTIKTQNHELNISLQYSTTGLRPSEEASWVGLGWALNAGGVITRVVRGLDDLDMLHGTGYRGGACLPGSDANYDYAPSSNSSAEMEMFYNMLKGTQDGEPDIFYYNFGPNSGKFVLDKHPTSCSASTGAVLMAQRNNLAIVYDDANGYSYSKWVITDGNGYKYTFSQQEATLNYSCATEGYIYATSEDVITSVNPSRVNIWQRTPSQDLYGMATSWYLTSIVSPEGETITLTYKSSSLPSNFGSYTLANAVSSTISTNEEDYWMLAYSGGNCWGLSGRMSNIQHSFQNHYVSYLEKIAFNGGYVLFNNPLTTNLNDTYRDDLLSDNATKPKKLRSMEVYDDKNTLVKRFLLTYGYFNTAANGSSINSDSRLRLDNVVEYGSDGSTAKKPYLFTYKSGVLPSKVSTGLDFLGYNNWMTGNPSLLPNLANYTNPYNGTIRTYKGGDRTPTGNLNDLLPGTLDKVVYPTGGLFDVQLRTEYVYGQRHAHNWRRSEGTVNH